MFLPNNVQEAQIRYQRVPDAGNLQRQQLRFSLV